MNRYRAGGPSKATATTQCQKCLKRGHYSYECTAKQQDRPYTSRPSRTQQLANPKLAPKITEATPPKPEGQKKGELGHHDSASLKRKLDEPAVSSRKRSRSVSSYSSDSDSISTISTNASRSRSPSRSPPRRKGTASPKPNHAARDRSPAPRRRRSFSRSRSADSDRPRQRKGRGERSLSRRGNSRSRSPARGARRRSASRSRSPYKGGRDNQQRRDFGTRQRSPLAPRQRSLSPYSKRIALTRATQGSA